MRRDKVTNDEIEKSHFDILIIKLNIVHKQLSSPVFLYSFNSVEIFYIKRNVYVLKIPFLYGKIYIIFNCFFNYEIKQYCTYGNLMKNS